MGLLNLIFGSETAKYDVTVYYKCKNCDKTIFKGTYQMTISLDKHDGKAELQDKVIQQLLYPYGDKNKPMNGYVLHFGHRANSQYFPIQPHNCEDGRVGISEFSAVNIIQ
jgi:hypothetical protein